MSMTLELLPCPFCGGEAFRDGGDENQWCVTGCKSCGFFMSDGPTDNRASADAAWNRRIAQPAQSVDVEKVREVIATLDCVGSAGSDHYSSEYLQDAINDASDKLSQAIGDKT